MGRELLQPSDPSLVIFVQTVLVVDFVQFQDLIFQGLGLVWRITGAGALAVDLLVFFHFVVLLIAGTVIGHRVSDQLPRPAVVRIPLADRQPGVVFFVHDEEHVFFSSGRYRRKVLNVGVQQQVYDVGGEEEAGEQPVAGKLNCRRGGGRVETRTAIVLRNDGNFEIVVCGNLAVVELRHERTTGRARAVAGGRQRLRRVHTRRLAFHVSFFEECRRCHGDR